MSSAALFRRPWQLVFLLAAAVMMLAVACDGGDDDDATSTATPDAGGGDGSPTASATAPDAGDLTDEQVLRVAIDGEPGAIDPQRGTDTDSIALLRQLYAGLLRLDENQVIQPDLATEVPTVENGGISEDGLTYTFHLKDGLMWSDGTPLVAQAFVDGAKRLFEPGSANYYADFYRVIAAGGAQPEYQTAVADGLEGDDLRPFEQAVVDQLEVEAPDDQTVVYHLNAQSPIFPLLATLWTLYPVRQDIVDSAGDAWTEAGTLVSNGPFALSSWNHDQDLTLVKNEFSHRAPLLDEISIDIIPDFAVAFLAYQQDELDVIKLGPEELVQVRGTELVDDFQNYAQLSTIGWYYNFEDPILQDDNVRLALTAGVDRAEYAEVVREGAVLPAYGWVPPGMPGHDPEVGMEFRDAIEQAQQWLVDAGFPDGEGLELEILGADSSLGIQRDEWLKEQWEANLGITVTIRTLDRATYFAERNLGNYQITTGGWGADYPDPQNWMPLFQTGHGLNPGKYSNADFDALIVAADTELDNDARIELYLQAQEILISEAGFAPMYYNGRQILVKPWVQGLVASSMESNMPGDLFFDLVYIDGRS